MEEEDSMIHLPEAEVDPLEPDVPIPINAAHEFLNRPLKADDTELLGWIQWFTKSGKRFSIMPGVAGRIQLYVHRFQNSAGTSKGSRWCCTSDELADVAAGERDAGRFLDEVAGL